MTKRDRIDVRDMHVCVVDLRAATGHSHSPVAVTRVVPAPHVYTLSVFAPLQADEPPVAEVLAWWQGTEVSIVGALTGRQGVQEVTPDQVEVAQHDSEYAQRLVAFLHGR